MMTSEGVAPQGVDGKMSTNKAVRLPAKEASGISQYRNQIMGYHTSTAHADWQSRQTWQDLWQLNY
jgi:iron(III) transport system substrate-binding protein